MHRTSHLLSPQAYKVVWLRFCRTSRRKKKGLLRRRRKKKEDLLRLSLFLGGSQKLREIREKNIRLWTSRLLLVYFFPFLEGGISPQVKMFWRP